MIGWRWWTLRGETLISVTYETKWEGPTLRADKKPTAKNSHGVHAMGSKKGIGRWKPSQDRRVYGQVELSGTVVRGETGFRAERATIRVLYVKRAPFVRLKDDGLRYNTYGEWPDKAVIEALERRYQCDVRVVDTEPKGDSPNQLFSFAGNWMRFPAIRWSYDQYTSETDDTA